jgi:endonuclease/exonuclease/phosphatase (EEP) superfamily protein YafD
VVRWSEATDEVEAAPGEEFFDDEPRRRSRKVSFFLVVFALAFVAYAVVRIMSLENTAFLVGAMALTPYVAAGCLLLALVTVVLGRKLLALVVLITALALGALLGPRYFSEEQPAAGGQHLRIMAANLHLGQGDARTIVDLVRRQQVDVLTLPELTPAAVTDLDRAGLAELLPYRVFDARRGGDGSGIAANVPLRQVVLVEDSALSQPSAIVDLPGRRDLELTAVHVQPPLSSADVRTWRAELAKLPRPEPKQRLSILAGDFNATLDHVAFRDLVDRGYADAAEETGDGLIPTWANWPTGPPLTIDHIVADARCAISSYAVFNLPNSDHDVVLAEVVLP